MVTRNIIYKLTNLLSVYKFNNACFSISQLFRPIESGVLTWFFLVRKYIPAINKTKLFANKLY